MTGRRFLQLTAVALTSACSGVATRSASAPLPAGGPQAADDRDRRAPGGPVLTAATLNIWHNQEDWPARLEYIVETLRSLRPDVIGLQEVLQNPELPNQAQTIAEQIGYAWYFASVDSVGSAKRYGNAILTPHPVLTGAFRKLEPLSDYRVAAHVRIRIDQDSVDVYVTHLHHTPEGGAIRRTQLLDLLDFVSDTRAHGPLLVLGDFNAAMTEPEMNVLAGRMSDAFKLFHENAEAVTTLNPAKGHRPVRIDHIFYSHGPTRALRPLSADLILNRPNAAGLWASDHFGVAARFELVGW